MNLLLLSLLAFGLSQVASAALPDMQNVARPSPEPALPAQFDAFTPPVDASTPAASTPAFAEWIRTGGPDDTIVATGDALSSYTGNDQGKDTEFMVYGQTTAGNGAQKAALIQRLDGLKTAFTLNPALPKWSMYLVWPKNSAGCGYPIAVNRTEAWWLGPKKAETGQTVAVYGRNLSHDNATKISWVYIKKNGTSVVSVPATSVNPYRVAFTVPGDLTNGDYEVWTHNGHGGHYGWSGPLTLTVYTRQTWTGPKLNVKTYGALGNGVADDGTAIQAALTAAGKTAGSTVYFPAGTYMTSKGFTPPNNCRILGDGMDRSFIKLHANYSAPSYSLLFADSQPRSTFDVQDITLDANGHLKGKSNTLVYLRSSSDVRFSGVRIHARSYQPCDFHGSTGLYLSNCEIIGAASFLGNATQVFIDGCDHHGTDDATATLIGWGVAEMSVMNSTARDCDNTQPWGWSKGRFYAGNGARAASTRGVYFGNNTTYDLTVRPGIPDQNSGEQILYENGLTYYRGTPIAATATTVAFSGLTTSHTGKEAIIVKGKGLGQHRKITGFASGTVTISPAWNVIPDVTSEVIFETMSEKLVVYDNYFDAKDSTAGTASVGVENYGGAYDWVVDANTFNQVGTAIFNISIGQDPKKPVSPDPILDIQPVYWQLNVNNTMLDAGAAGWSTLSWYNNAAADPGLAALGHVFRRNAVSSGSGFGIKTTRYWHSTGKPMDMVVFEHNTGTSLSKPIDTSGGTFLQSALAHKNSFDRGTASFSGSKGLCFGSGQTPGLQGNTWLNYQTVYSGTLPGAVLELPVRSFEISSSSNPVAVMQVWNSGTAAMSWTASDDAAWFALSATSGSAPSEGGNNVTITCNPSALAVGTYNGVITITAGAQTKTVGVAFTVGGVSNVRVKAPE